ncbi:MAG: ABC transporter ATP-binding protein [Desulfobulbaceae bacterium]|nr:ABC transporter ATP-binding protein [Desulfobulbaceae bacterium]
MSTDENDSNMGTVVSFCGVTKNYTKELGAKAHTAVDGLSFDIKQGEALGLIGVNGAGKSTSIRLLMDFIRPDQGVITLLQGTPCHYQLRQKVGYLPETASFPANLTVLDMLHFAGTTCNIHKKILDKRCHDLLTMLDLWSVRCRPLRTYSKGMQQRANFAIALVNDPELLILDEPMSGLDPIGRGKIGDLIQRLKGAGKTILFCSHILEDVDRLVDNILLLHKGKKLFYGPPSELAAQEMKTSMSEAFVSVVNREEGHV